MSLIANNWAVLGSLAAAVVAGIYVFWGPSERKKRNKRDSCPGLVNLGNTCFLNSVLQSWASCRSLTHWLGDFIDRKTDKEYSQYLAFRIVNALKVLNNESLDNNDPYNPADIVESLRAHRWIINSDEQDAHELFHVFTETLSEEISQYPSVVSILDVKSLQHTATHSQSAKSASTRQQCSLPVLPSRTECNHPFKGALASRLQCCRCGHKYPVKFDSFDSLSLSLPNSAVYPFTLDQLLRRFVSTETVPNVNCERCSKARHTSSAPEVSRATQIPFSKSLAIGKLPQCLCIHIQRTVWLDNGMPMKRFEHVQFPEILSMDDYVHHKCSQRTVYGGLLFGGRASSERIPSQVGIPVTPNAGLVSGIKTQQTESSRTGRVLNNTSSEETCQLAGQEVGVKGDTLDEISGSQKLCHSLPVSGQSVPSVLSLPAEKLRNEMTQRCMSQQEKLYHLVSVVCHMGDVLSGHFICYRRAPPVGGEPSRIWLRTSDELVTRVDISEVLMSTAYLLFYEKMT